MDRTPRRVTGGASVGGRHRPQPARRATAGARVRPRGPGDRAAARPRRLRRLLRRRVRPARHHGSGRHPRPPRVRRLPGGTGAAGRRAPPHRPARDAGRPAAPVASDPRGRALDGIDPGAALGRGARRSGPGRGGCLPAAVPRRRRGPGGAAADGPDGGVPRRRRLAAPRDVRVDVRPPDGGVLVHRCGPPRPARPGGPRRGQAHLGHLPRGAPPTSPRGRDAPPHRTHPLDAAHMSGPVCRGREVCAAAGWGSEGPAAAERGGPVPRRRRHATVIGSASVRGGGWPAGPAAAHHGRPLPGCPSAWSGRAG